MLAGMSVLVPRHLLQKVRHAGLGRHRVDCSSPFRWGRYVSDVDRVGIDGSNEQNERRRGTNSMQSLSKDSEWFL